MTDQHIPATLSDVLAELKAIRELLTTRTLIPPHPRKPLDAARVADRVLWLMAKSSDPYYAGCHSVLLRRCKCHPDDLADALRELQDKGAIKAIEGKHGFRYELVSHTPAATDACPLSNEASPV